VIQSVLQLHLKSDQKPELPEDFDHFYKIISEKHSMTLTCEADSGFILLISFCMAEKQHLTMPIQTFLPLQID
jgi:hypothetical protein